MAKRKIEPIQEIRTFLEKPKEVFQQELEERVAKGNELMQKQIGTSDQYYQLSKDFNDWDDYNEELLKRSFNKTQNEYFQDYNDCAMMLGIDDVLYRRDTDSPTYKLYHLRKTIDLKTTVLSQLIVKLPLIAQDKSLSLKPTQEMGKSNKCFIIHGHNETKKLELARFLEVELKIETTILHEKPNIGRTIIEKFEDYSGVDFAVALWTADDEGKSKMESDLTDRARQNVIFETGYFIGKLGRKRVIVLYENSIEIPSDYLGVIFIRIADNWKNDLRREILAIYHQ